jgi:hypothetical protein
MGANVLPITVRTTAPDFKLKGKKIKEKFALFLKNTHEEISLMAKDTLKESIQIKGKVATGTLLNSVYRRLLQRSSLEFVSNIGFQKPASEYAFFANYGRASGKKPPFSAIAKWAASKGIEDERFIWFIVNKIGEEGTEGGEFIEHAEPIIERKRKSIFRERLEEFKRTL